MNAATKAADLEILAAEQCWALLGTTSLGRVGLTRAALPTILPVLFAARDGGILFRAHRGALLDAAERGDVVCFEADSATHPAWSVVVTGALAMVAESTPADRVSIPTWPAAERGRLVELHGELISGRRQPMRLDAVPSRRASIESALARPRGTFTPG